MSFSRGAWGARQPTLHLGVVVLTAGAPPADGADLTNLDTHRAATVHDWMAGISTMDALQP